MILAWPSLASPGRPPSGRVVGGHGGSWTLRGSVSPLQVRSEVLGPASSGAEPATPPAGPLACAPARQPAAPRNANEAPLFPRSCGPALLAAGRAKARAPVPRSPSTTVAPRYLNVSFVTLATLLFSLDLCSWESVGRGRSQLRAGLHAGLAVRLGVWGLGGFGIFFKRSLPKPPLVYDLRGRVFQIPYLEWQLECQERRQEPKLSPKLVGSFSKTVLSEELRSW